MLQPFSASIRLSFRHARLQVKTAEQIELIFETNATLGYLIHCVTRRLGSQNKAASLGAFPFVQAFSSCRRCSQLCVLQSQVDLSESPTLFRHTAL